MYINNYYYNRNGAGIIVIEQINEVSYLEDLILI